MYIFSYFLCLLVFSTFFILVYIFPLAPRMFVFFHLALIFLPKLLPFSSNLACKMNSRQVSGSQKTPLELDRERVTCLLLINAQLIKKAYNLYVNVLSNPQAIQQLLPPARTALQEQQTNLSRRVQCNISVLSYINDKYHNKAAASQPNRLQFPIILSAPPDMPELNNYYRKLQDLYPEALQFLKMKIQQMRHQQESNNSNRTPISTQAPPPPPPPPQTIPADPMLLVNNNSPMTANPQLSSGANRSQINQSQFPMSGTFNPQSASMSFQNTFSDPLAVLAPQSQNMLSISPQNILQQMNDQSSNFAGNLNQNQNQNTNMLDFF